MNERIKELALQAGAVNVWEWASDDVLDTKNMDAKKFAELIVKECAEIADTAEPFLASDLIKEHFGIDQ